MKIIHISQTDIIGGAARAAYRLHTSLLSAGIKSRMMVRRKKSDDWTVIGASSKIHEGLNIIRAKIGSKIDKLQKTTNTNFHSGDWLPSRWANRINKSNADIVNLHWVAGETMSIEDIGRICKPIVWTLHDMWPFCGMEHVTEYGENARWRHGYKSNNRSSLDRGLDLDRLVWIRKKRSWQHPMHIIAPSHWMADCAKHSALLKKHMISVIPNVLDTDVYKPLDSKFCRQSLNLPEDKKIILFGAIGGGKDNNKGYDFLIDALEFLSRKIKSDDVLCVIFGQGKPKNEVTLPFDTKWMGHISDDTTLSLLYNSASVMIVPSRIENLPQTATESQACGTPVVAFNTTGLKDVIIHKQTGYLAEPFNSIDLANGIEWVLNERSNSLDLYCRLRALDMWGKNTVLEQYISIYRSMLNLPDK